MTTDSLRNFRIESRTYDNPRFAMASAALKHRGSESGSVILPSNQGKGFMIVSEMSGSHPNAALYATIASHVGLACLDRGESAKKAIETASEVSHGVETLLGKYGELTGIAVEQNGNDIAWACRGNLGVFLLSDEGVDMLSQPQWCGLGTTRIRNHIKPLTGDAGSIALENDQVLAIATDGIWRYIRPEHMIQALCSSNKLEDRARSCVQHATERMASGNVFVVLMCLRPSAFHV